MVIKRCHITYFITKSDTAACKGCTVLNIMDYHALNVLCIYYINCGLVCISCLSCCWYEIVCDNIFSMILQWAIALSMGRRWIRSQVDAGGPTARSGGAPKMHTRAPSTVSATCTVAATVQESLWNHKP